MNVGLGSYTIRPTSRLAAVKRGSVYYRRKANIWGSFRSFDSKTFTFPAITLMFFRVSRSAPPQGLPFTYNFNCHKPLLILLVHEHWGTWHVHIMLFIPNGLHTNLSGNRPPLYYSHPFHSLPICSIPHRFTNIGTSRSTVLYVHINLLLSPVHRSLLALVSEEACSLSLSDIQNAHIFRPS